MRITAKHPTELCVVACRVSFCFMVRKVSFVDCSYTSASRQEYNYFVGSY